MSSTTKNTLVVIVVIIIVVLLFYVFRGSFSSNTVSPMDMSTTSVATTTATGSTASAGTGSSNNGGVPGGTAFIDNDAALNAVLASSAIRVPTTGVEVALTQGNADFANGSQKGHVTLGRVLAKVPTNDGYDVFTDMVLTKPTDSSMIHYVALFKVVGQSVNYTSAVVVGDRLVVQSVSPKADTSAKMTAPQSIMNSQTGYILTINYLDRKNGEPVTATPTVQKSMDVHVKNGVVTQ